MGKPAEGAARVGPSPEVIERIKKAIAEAETIEEVTRLERALKSGVLPDDLKAPKPEAPKPAVEEKPPAVEVQVEEEKPSEKRAPEKTEEVVEKIEETPKEDEKMDVDEGKKEDDKAEKPD